MNENKGKHTEDIDAALIRNDWLPRSRDLRNTKIVLVNNLEIGENLLRSFGR